MGALKYLLDSNVLSEPMRPQPSSSVLERLASAFDACAIAAPVLHELEFGVLRLAPSRRRTVLTQYLDRVIGALPVLPYDAEVAKWHARERARLTKLGRSPAFVDGQIAAIASAHALVLVTRNVEDFSSYPGLRIENWF